MIWSALRGMQRPKGKEGLRACESRLCRLRSRF